MTAENVPNAPQQSRNQTNRHWILPEATEATEGITFPLITRMNADGEPRPTPESDFTGGRRGSGGIPETAVETTDFTDRHGLSPQSIRVYPCPSVVKNVWVIFENPRPSARSAEKSVAELGLWIEADSVLSVSSCKFLFELLKNPLSLRRLENDVVRPFSRTAPGKSGSPAANSR